MAKKIAVEKKNHSTATAATTTTMGKNCTYLRFFNFNNNNNNYNPLRGALFFFTRVKFYCDSAFLFHSNSFRFHRVDGDLCVQQHFGTYSLLFGIYLCGSLFSAVNDDSCNVSDGYHYAVA